MRRCLPVCVLALLALAIPTRDAAAYMKEGVARGQVITVGEDRLVVQSDAGGQITFEVANVKQGDQWVKDTAQLALIKTFKQGDRVSVEWGQDHTGHHYIRAISRASLDGRPIPEVQREGRVQGTVIAVGEERLAVQKSEGGQITLEPGWRKIGSTWLRNPDHVAFFRTLKQGDKVEATWKLDEGTHFCVQTITRSGAGAPRQGGSAMAAEVTGLRSEVSELRKEIASLREMLNRLLEQRKQ